MKEGLGVIDRLKTEEYKQELNLDRLLLSNEGYIKYFSSIIKT